MLVSSKFLDPARDFASRIDLSTKSQSGGWFLYDQVYLFGKVLLLTVVKKTLHKRDTVSGSFQRFTRRQSIGHASIACDNI